jgi:glycine cleavage system H protein
MMTKGSLVDNGEFQEGKAWFQREGTVVVIGLTSSAIEDIGEVTDVQFPDEGDVFERGDVVVTIEGNQGTMELITPVSGSVSEFNQTISDEPEVVSDDPLEEGWLIKIQSAEQPVADDVSDKDEEEEEDTDVDEDEEEDVEHEEESDEDEERE